MVTFSCARCLRRYRLSRDKAGIRVLCKPCGSVLTVPESVELPEDCGFELLGDPDSTPPEEKAGVVCDSCLRVFLAPAGGQALCPGCGRPASAPELEEVERSAGPPPDGRHLAAHRLWAFKCYQCKQECIAPSMESYTCSCGRYYPTPPGSYGVESRPAAMTERAAPDGRGTKTESWSEWQEPPGGGAGRGRKVVCRYLALLTAVAGVALLLTVLASDFSIKEERLKDADRRMEKAWRDMPSKEASEQFTSAYRSKQVAEDTPGWASGFHKFIWAGCVLVSFGGLVLFLLYQSGDLDP